MSEKLKHQICGQVQGPISCKYLLSMLYDLSGTKGELVMSARNIHQLTGFSTSTILRAMRQLERLGHIKVIHRTNEDGGCASNQYVLNLSGGG